MFSLRDKACLPIGVDIGARAVRMLQLRQRGDRFDLVAAAATDLAPSDWLGSATYHNAVINALGTLRARHKFYGTQCVTSLPPDRVACKSLRMPQMPEADIDQAIRWEAKDRMGFDMAEGQLAYFRSGEIRRGNETKDEYLLFAATPETLTAHIEQIAEAGLVALAVDLQPCALLRSLQRITPGEQAAGVTAIVDLGAVATQFMVAQEDRLAFYKNIEIGDQALNAAVADKLGIPLNEAVQLRQRFAQRDPSDSPDSADAPLEQAFSDALRPLLENLARELDLCLRYCGVTFRGARPEIIHASGGQSYGQRSLDLLGAGVGSRLEIIQPLRGVGSLGNYARPDRSSDWAVATGLSLYPTAAKPQQVAA